MVDTQTCVAAATLATLPLRMKNEVLLPIARNFLFIYWLSQILQKTISTNAEFSVVHSR